MTKVSVSILLLVLMFWVRERRCADDDDDDETTEKPAFDAYEFKECENKWNSRYPWLVEVRYTKDEYDQFFRFHNSRHGVLLTPYVVLTRGHDLEGYPRRAPEGKPWLGDMLPVARNPEECHKPRKACIYVNIRRPIKENEGYTGQFCGQNIVVKKIIMHPKFNVTADVDLIFKREGGFAMYKNFLMNLKYPFAVALLNEPVDTTNPTQTFIPTVILPRTPLDFMYLLRRVDTLGPESKLCEFPTYNGLDHEGFYSTYNENNETVIRLRQPQYRDLKSVLCPGDFGLHGKGYEGSRGGNPGDDIAMQNICNQTLFKRTLPISFLAWTGPWPTLDYATLEDFELNGFDSTGRLTYSLEMLGAPVVCDGTLIGITSTWHGRGRDTGLADLFIGTTWFRVYSWLIEVMTTWSSRYYHRYRDDDPFLFNKKPIKKALFPLRNYDKSVFELSLNEPLATFSGSQTPQISIFAIFLPSVIVRLFGGKCL